MLLYPVENLFLELCQDNEFIVMLVAEAGMTLKIPLKGGFLQISDIRTLAVLVPFVLNIALEKSQQDDD